jgi:hypothetical protein
VVTRQQTGGNPAAQASQASRQLQANLDAEGRHVTEFLLTVDQTISPLQQVQQRNKQPLNAALLGATTRGHLLQRCMAEWDAYCTCASPS